MRPFYRNDEGLRSEIGQHHLILSVLLVKVLQLGCGDGELDFGIQP